MAKTDGMDAVALLKADHRKVESLFEKYERTKSESKKKALAAQICMELTVHTKIEEDIFYPACKDQVDDDLWHEAYVEHDGAKVMISQIEEGSPDDEFYDAKVKVLSEMIKHHVKEEEKRSEYVCPGETCGIGHGSAGRTDGPGENKADGGIQIIRLAKTADSDLRKPKARLKSSRTGDIRARERTPEYQLSFVGHTRDAETRAAMPRLVRSIAAGAGYGHHFHELGRHGQPRAERYIPFR